ncbi:hypothetical protein RPMD05_69 [Rhodobacteraceae phage LS06-2018-MD05]|nr:hypothetical protein RPMD05_69 [Rhodobacteraceae phage LS06-2018-MD05]
MTEQKQYTLEELKQKLIDKTMEYTNLESANNQIGANIRDDIRIISDSIRIIEGKSIDSDFQDCLNELLNSKISNNPTKNRF